ncbi:hypothetical protein HDU67_010152, partial [Dinochytrium kinnereticum]
MLPANAHTKLPTSNTTTAPTTTIFLPNTSASFPYSPDEHVDVKKYTDPIQGINGSPPRSMTMDLSAVETMEASKDEDDGRVNEDEARSGQWDRYIVGWGVVVGGDEGWGVGVGGFLGTIGYRDNSEICGGFHDGVLGIAGGFGQTDVTA